MTLKMRFSYATAVGGDEKHWRWPREFTPKTGVDTMLKSRAKWDAVCGFVVYVLKTREEEERQRQ